MSDPVVPTTYTYPLPRISSFLPETEYSASEYHHDFQSNPSCTDVTVTLVSRDKILFCVRASALREASSVFEAALSQIQRPETGTSREPVIDNLDEDAKTIEGLLRMITGRALPPLDTLESIEPLTLAAGKWQMLGPLSILRMLLLRDKSFVVNNPIRLYWLGCRLKWTELSNMASTYSCNSDIYYKPALEPVLRCLDSGDLLRLVKFHRRRRDCMQAYFDAMPVQRGLCIHGSHFQDLRSRFLESMDHIPPGNPPVESALRLMVTQSRPTEASTCNTRMNGCYPVTSPQALGDLLVPGFMAQWPRLPQDIST